MTDTMKRKQRRGLASAHGLAFPWLLLLPCACVDGFAPTSHCQSTHCCVATPPTTTTSGFLRRPFQYRRLSMSKGSDDASFTLPTNGSKDMEVRTAPGQQGEDSIPDFAHDIAYVLGTLRATEDDPSIPLLFHRRSRSPTFTHPWTVDDWELHFTRQRFLNYLKNFPSSRILKRIFPQLVLLVAWSIFVVVALPSSATTSASTTSTTTRWSAQFIAKAALPLTPLSLVSTFVAALLTLRTNQCLSRLLEARVATGHVVAYTRQMAQLVASTVHPKCAPAALLAARHLALYGWLLRAQLKGLDSSNGNHDADLICTMLPNRRHGGDNSNNIQTPSPSAAYLLAHRKKPLAVLAVLRQIFAALESQLTTSQASSLDVTVQQLNHCTYTAERILASPIPPLYSAHTGRLLMFNLVFLPLALRGSLHRVATIITTAAVGFAMLGLDEISHLLENPFRLMPLWYLAKNNMKDVGDTLTCRPPALTRVLLAPCDDDDDDKNHSNNTTNGDNGGDDTTTDDSSKDELPFVPPPYW